MAKYPNIYLPMKRPEDVIPYLGKGELHWKEGRSARLLAEQWFAANGLPASVRAVLAQAEEWRGAAMLAAWPEHVTELPWGRGAGTQTDMLALIKLAGGPLAVLGIEAKVDETLGPLVSDWLAEGGSNRAERLAGLCALFGLETDRASTMRYQVLHRLAGTVLEAQRFGVRHAAVLVQSWCPNRTGLDAFSAFAEAVGLDAIQPGQLSDALAVGDVDLRIGWVAEAL